MSLRAFPVDFVPYASAIWAAAGIILFYQRIWLIGALYGLSGLFYLLVYLGFQDARYAVLHFCSDISFIIGLLVVVWPKGISAHRGSSGRSISWGDYQEVAKNKTVPYQVVGCEK